MKLTINRREKSEGFIFKSTVYYLDVNLEFTESEKQLIKKHKWNNDTLFNASVNGGIDMRWPVDYFFKPTTFRFTTVGELAKFESELVESAKKIKNSLENVGDFATDGPMEVQL